MFFRSNDCCGGCCCSIDVWGIALNIVLQDAPFLAFRLLIIIHYRIISYMNVFFTCKWSSRSQQIRTRSVSLIRLQCFAGKNTLVILLQLYRLYVVHSENKVNEKKKTLAALKANSRKRNDLNEMNQFNDIYIISSGKLDKRRSKRFDFIFVQATKKIIAHSYVHIYPRILILHRFFCCYIFIYIVSKIYIFRQTYTALFK